MFKMIGLRAENAQGWLAAVGVAYLLDRQGHDPILYWEGQHPILLNQDAERVIDALAEYLAQDSDLLANLPQGVKGEKAALDLSAGRVSFTGVIETMLKSVSRDKIAEALLYPWKNQDDITSLGWDIGAIKQGATSGGDKAPTDAPHRGVLAGQWLAAESLPVTGTGPRSDRYAWVTWSLPLDMEGVRSVVLSRSPAWGGRVYEAKVGRNGQMGYLQPARTLSGQEMPGGSRSLIAKEDWDETVWQPGASKA